MNAVSTFCLGRIQAENTALGTGLGRVGEVFGRAQCLQGVRPLQVPLRAKITLAGGSCALTVRKQGYASLVTG